MDEDKVCHIENGVLVCEPKNKNGKVEITALRSPISGAPLEPSKEYGHSILYSPHEGSFSAVQMPGGGTVTPRFTELEQKSVEIIKRQLHEAGDILRRDKSDKAVERAYSLFDAASRVEPYHQYPEAGLQKNAVFIQMREEANMVGNYVLSARESKGSEKSGWYGKARDRILSAERILT